jgi:hypothetical protein
VAVSVCPATACLCLTNQTNQPTNQTHQPTKPTHQGYVGPIPSKMVEGKGANGKGEEWTLKFEGIPLAKGAAQSEMVSTGKVCASRADATLKKPKGY